MGGYLSHSNYFYAEQRGVAHQTHGISPPYGVRTVSYLNLSHPRHSRISADIISPMARRKGVIGYQVMIDTYWAVLPWSFPHERIEPWDQAVL
jgi:hypothetical protein